MANVTEHPILFSGEMVRAILAGHKTQTRRVVLPYPRLETDDQDKDSPDFGEPLHLHSVDCPSYCDYACGRRVPDEWTPYGVVGDHLWVRETFRVNGNKHDLALANKDSVFYRADEPYMDKGDYRPSIHMPRRLSRITLEVTAVRVQRLQQIGLHEIIAEGVEKIDDPSRGIAKSAPQLKASFMRLWDGINAKRGYSWESNPWVWVVSFKQVKQ